MLKVGDELLCKKVFDFFKISTDFLVNNYYTIKIIDKTDNSILIEKIWFSLNKTSKNSLYRVCIWDHFYTPQELRKLKLEKLKFINFLV